MRKSRVVIIFSAASVGTFFCTIERNLGLVKNHLIQQKNGDLLVLVRARVNVLSRLAHTICIMKADGKAFEVKTRIPIDREALFEDVRQCLSLARTEERKSLADATRLF
jgi:hypothetical protein